MDLNIDRIGWGLRNGANHTHNHTQTSIMCNPGLCTQVKKNQAAIIGEIYTVKQMYGPNGILAEHLNRIEEYAEKTFEILEDCPERKGVKK